MQRHEGAHMFVYTCENVPMYSWINERLNPLYVICVCVCVCVCVMMMMMMAATGNNWQIWPSSHSVAESPGTSV